MNISLEEVLERRYTFVVQADPEVHGWVIIYPDLPGCISQAESYEEIGELARDALVTWVSAQIEDGRPIPVPGLHPNPEWDWESAGESLMTSAEVAQRMGVSQRRVLALAKSRGLGRKIGRSVMFRDEDIIALSPGPVGRPPRSA